MNLFKLRGELSRQMSTVLAIGGLVLVVGVWSLLTMGGSPVLPAAILPSPVRVLGAFQDLYLDNDLVKNTAQSIGLNLAGYFEAIVIAIPIGFLVGLFPLFRGGFERQVGAIRYIPITAVTALFIGWFGVGTSMKMHFLAFGIIIYFLPIIIQRIDEVKDVYLKTVYTLGASKWQTIRTVYLPSAISRFSDDLRVLTAISWTYIIFAESIHSTGGIGSLIWRAGMRQGRADKVFALLIIIMLIGVIQDKLLIRLDRHFFPHKYQIKDQHKAGRLRQESVFSVIWHYGLRSIGRIFMGLYLVLFANEIIPFLNVRPLSYLFQDSVWVVHVIMLLVITYTVYQYWKKKQTGKPKQVAS